MPDIDPQEFGRLQAEVTALRRDYEGLCRTVDRMAGQMDDLMALANRGKGGLFTFMSMAAAIGSIVGWFASRGFK